MMSEQSTDQLIEKYLQDCKFEKGLSGKTLKAYRIDLNQFSTYLNDSSALTCGKEDIQRYLSILYERYKMKSVKRKIATLKAFFNYLEDEELLEGNPFAKLHVKLHEPLLLCIVMCYFLFLNFSIALTSKEPNSISCSR